MLKLNSIYAFTISTVTGAFSALIIDAAAVVGEKCLLVKPHLGQSSKMFSVYATHTKD